MKEEEVVGEVEDKPLPEGSGVLEEGAVALKGGVCEEKRERDGKADTEKLGEIVPNTFVKVGVEEGVAPKEGEELGEFWVDAVANVLQVGLEEGEEVTTGERLPHIE